ncbi:peptidoglycan DD-metalloendopeptidase family protein [Streptomyces sp. NPDC008150]|uniref:M23 family metallopeptidase n=1 Tax=Streptomyces sp. NPDC008150 TaxID=3364816 RepID=UPI0036E39C2C
MPAQGKHRRSKAQRLTRTIAVAGTTGGMALALPLIGAAGAHAATQQSAPAQQSAAHGATTYTVKSGDWLARIAEQHHVDGGWKKLYQDNRAAVGSDPSLIHAGLKLTLGTGSATAGASTTATTSSSTESNSAAQKATSGSSDATAATTSTDSGAHADSASTSTGYTLPVTGATIGTGYHVAGSMWSSGYHTGVDFVVPTGTSVKAIAAGTVVSAGYDGAYGNEVVIKHADGKYSQYAHMSQLSVSTGQTVTEGQQIGLSGATGNVTGPHMHFEIRTTPYYGSDVDPVAYLSEHGVTVG